MSNTALKNIRYKWSVLKTVFTCFFGISLFFIFSSIPSNFIGNYLHVDASYIGGLVSADFVDPAGDDIGEGTDYALRYPLNKSFTEGSLDLVRYTVHQPVTNARWQQSAEYWQLSLEYKSGPAIVRNIMIYIDADNIDGGKTETLFDSAEKVCFDEEHPWDFALWLWGNEGKLYDSNGDFICNTEYYNLKNDTQIKIRIPLRDKRIQKILGAEKTWHYVLTGGYSQFDRGAFMPLEKKPAMSHGGLKNAKNFNALIPPLYDILGPNEALGSWNAESFEKAKLSPVEASMTAHKKTKSEDEKIQAYINYVKQIYSETFSPKMEASNQSETKSPNTLEENLSFYKQKITENPEDYVSMAYYGSYLAVKGGESSVMKAVALVNEAYTYLDKAAELACGKEGEIDVLLNRASVSASVPEQVFGKSESGAQDFMKIISLTDNEILKAYCYVMAYGCYQKCGKETQAILSLQEAEKMVKLN